MIFFPTNVSTLFKVNVSVLSTRDGDPFLNSKLNLLLRKSLPELQFKEQQTYLENATYAAHFSLNKLHRQHRINFKVNLQTISEQTDHNFTQGSTSSGLAYGLATFITYWKILLGNNTSAIAPIFATGEIDKQGGVSAIDFVAQKIDFICAYIKAQHDVSAFNICIPDANKHQVSEQQRELIQAAGGRLITGKELGDYLEQLFPDEYIKDPGLSLAPFKVRVPYEMEDTLGFFGRGRETRELQNKIHKNNGVVILSGPSNSGRTSLIQAGLYPLLKKEQQQSIFITLSVTDLEKEDGVFNGFVNLFLQYIKPVASNGEYYQRIEESLIGAEQYEQANELLNNLGYRFYFTIDDINKAFTQNDSLHNVKKLIVFIKEIACLSTVFIIEDKLLAELLELDEVGMTSVISTSPPSSVDVWQEIITNKALFFNFEIEPNLRNEIIKAALMCGKESLPVINYLLDMFYQRAKKENIDKINLTWQGNEKQGGISDIVISIIDRVLNDKPQQVIDNFFLEILSLDANGKLMIKGDMNRCTFFMVTTRALYAGDPDDIGDWYAHDYAKRLEIKKQVKAEGLSKLLPLIDISNWKNAKEFFAKYHRFLGIRKQLDVYIIDFEVNEGAEHILTSSLTYQFFEFAKIRGKVEKTKVKGIARFVNRSNKHETLNKIIHDKFQKNAYLSIPFTVQMKFVLAIINYIQTKRDFPSDFEPLSALLRLARRRFKIRINLIIGSVFLFFIIWKTINS